MARVAGSSPNQGALPLEARGGGAILTGACNRDALRAVFGEPWTGVLYLEAPPGSGKSLVAATWAAERDAELVAAGNLDLETAMRAANRGAAAVDGLEALSAGEEALFHLFNALAQGGSLLLTGRVPPRGLRVGLRDLATRLHSVLVVTIGAPDEAFLRRLLELLVEARQLTLPAPVASFLIQRMGRTQEAAVNLVEALDRLSLESGRPVSRELAAEALKQAGAA